MNGSVGPAASPFEVEVVIDEVGTVHEMRTPVTRLHELSRDECLELLAGARVGRLGVSIEALPTILPVNFAMLGERIVIRTVPGTKLDAAVEQAVVAFEVDGYDPAGGWGWSVLVRGRGMELMSADDLAEASRLPLRAWAFTDKADRYLSIDTTLVSGRRFEGTPR
jgi:nitroimidazol reductase NimA-like FMN-containing flavoprotein (pyridoxamine 5'-phosphate oxidase superfamily)